MFPILFAFTLSANCLFTDSDCEGTDASCNGSAAAAIAGAFLPTTNTVTLPAPGDIADLRLYMPLNGDANDSSGNSFNGTVINGSFGTDRNGSANGSYTVAQNDNSAFIRMDENAFNSLGDFTVALWAKLDAVNGTGSTPLNTFFTTSNASRTSGDLLALDFDEPLNRINLSLHGRNQLPVINTTPRDLAWHHYAVSRSGTRVRVYLDGVELTAGAEVNLTSDVITAGTNGVVMTQELEVADSTTTGGTCACTGGFQPEQGLAGSIDEFRLYTRALSDLEILSLATNTP